MANPRLTAIAITMLSIAVFAPRAGAVQSDTLNIFGTVDLSLAHLRNGGGSQSGMAHSGTNVSRFGLRGTESLGGGYGTGFWLEAGFNPATGSGAGSNSDAGLTFNRRATVSGMGPFGELRLGRDDSVGFLSSLLFDPFMTNGVGGTNTFMMLGSPIQISNTVSYFLPPRLRGFHAQLQYAWGPTSTPESGSYKGARVGYAQGPLSVALAGAYQGNDALPGLKIVNLAGSYDLEWVKLSLIWAQERRGAQRQRGQQLGASMPIGPHVVRGSVGLYRASNVSPAGDARWRKFSVGYGYNASKRMQWYASYGLIGNGDNARRAVMVQGLNAPINTEGHIAQGVQVGIRTFF